MVLYVCRSGSSFMHPCRDAGEALKDAGHAFEICQVEGGIAKPWTWLSRAKDRGEIKRLSGQRGVPILVLDNGEVITGGSEIIEWARINAQAKTTTESPRRRPPLGAVTDDAKDGEAA